MPRTGKITLYKGIGKVSKKPFTALKLEVGDWDALYFPQGKLDMNYIEAYLSDPSEKPTDPQTQADSKIDLENEDELNENPFGN